MLAPGSLTTTTRPRVRRLAIEHAEEFLSRHPERARDFAVWALSNALVDAKNRRGSAWDLLKLAWRTRAVVTPWEVTANLERMRRTQVRWRSERRQADMQPLT
jgi:hypothetical protein